MTWNEYVAPGATSPSVQLTVWTPGAVPAIEHLLLVWVSIDQVMPDPVGSGSLMVTP